MWVIPNTVSEKSLFLSPIISIVLFKNFFLPRTFSSISTLPSTLWSITLISNTLLKYAPNYSLNFPLLYLIKPLPVLINESIASDN